MSSEATFKAVLEADATLLATATGGIWSFDETGRKGLSRTGTTAAYDSNGVIQPCVLVSERAVNPEFSLQDNSNQYMSSRQIVEIYFYSDASFADIETMKDRVYVLLHATQPSGMFRCEWAGTTRGPRDTEIDAWVERDEYLCILKRSTS